MPLLLSFLRGEGDPSRLDSCAPLEGRVVPGVSAQRRLLRVKPVVEGEAVL